VKRSTLDPSLLRAIAQVVERDHGSYDDALALVAEWEDVTRVNAERERRIRAQVARMPAAPAVEVERQRSGWAA
jgi:hypothetical protein